MLEIHECLKSTNKTMQVENRFEVDYSFKITTKLQNPERRTYNNVFLNSDSIGELSPPNCNDPIRICRGIYGTHKYIISEH